MQKLVAKYGLAAHLAIMAVAPLFLFPFFDDTAIATALAYLAAGAACWMVLEPSVRGGEMLHDARHRVLKALSHDAMFWVMAAVAMGGLMAFLNDGVELIYDAETRVWSVAVPDFPLLPGSVAGSGAMPAAAAFATLVVISSCRHSLGKAGRLAFLLIASSLAGAAAMLGICCVNQGNEAAVAATAFSDLSHSQVGTAFACHFIGGLVALVAAFERKWNRAMPFFLLAIGGTAAGTFAFATPFVILLTAAVAALTLAYVFGYARFVVKKQTEFKYLVAIVVVMALGAFVLSSVFPRAQISERFQACCDPVAVWNGLFDELRKVLSEVSFRSWKSHLWLGAGLGAFPLELKFGVQPADWQVVPHGLAMAANGWWQVLVERGIVGAVAILLPLGMMLFTYIKRMIRGFAAREWPHPAAWAGPLTVAAVAVLSFFDCSFLRADVLMSVSSLLAISANSFPRLRRDNV